MDFIDSVETMAMSASICSSLYEVTVYSSSKLDLVIGSNSTSPIITAILCFTIFLFVSSNFL